MDWLWGAALLPLVICGVVCLGGMALAAVGLRRGTSSDEGGHGQSDAGVSTGQERGAS